MTGSDAELLAAYRVAGKGNINYRTKEMTSEERNVRRMFLRRALIGTSFANRGNEDLDGMRVVLDHNIGGIWIEDIDGYLYHTEGEESQKKEANFRKERSRIPPEYKNLMAKDFKWGIYGVDLSEEQGKVLQYIARYEEFREEGMGLYIHSGTKGSGKTMLACCVLNEISSRYYGSVKFVNALDFLEMTKKGFNYDNPEVETLYICKTLVIDDIGAQLDKGWINTVFYRLVNDRYSNHKPTIYTSNLSIDQLEMDDRIIDRIDSTSFEIHLPEKSIRREQRKREKDKIMNAEKK